MAWFRRTKASVQPDQPRKDAPDGMWTKCDGCGEIIHRKQLEQQFYTCIKCNYHFRIGSREYVNILLDENSFRELDRKMRSTDPLEFTDTKHYKDRIKESMRRTELSDAVRTGTGKINKMPVAIGAMDFGFIGGSMGSVVGEKIARIANKALRSKLPLVIVSSSGGARMMEGALSLMQLAKTSAKLAQLSDAGIPFVSVMTDPTTGGVTASYAMLGDVNLAEPGALIGFAGPRVIKQTIGKDLPEGFQRSEFQLEHGFIDMVVHRKDLKETISNLLKMMWE
ncbi:MAG: acetyl-CoA carboxylase carboxyltransferase subunit beta [Ignavibacteriae bacterium]|nr:acetyl-CoA carboxylase carboxyltransferase subunit beta [Ignavibacteria bacterium]MBI3364840.1 acetyl-CoA carboxylase carboxyltransferase subunit beta [Ignavibacteriota bacterium]